MFLAADLSIRFIRCLDHQRVAACNGFTKCVFAPACGETANNESTVKARSLNYGCWRGPPTEVHTDYAPWQTACCDEHGNSSFSVLASWTRHEISVQ